MKSAHLGDLCRITSAKRIFESEYVVKGIPFIRGLEITDGSIKQKSTKYECYISYERYQELKSKHGVPKKGDILITAVGTIGNLCYVDFDHPFYYKDGNIIQFTDFREDIDSQYLYYYMKSPYFIKQLNNALIGAVQKALTMIMLKDIEIIIPTLSEQCRIVQTLSAIENKISNNSDINDILEKQAKLLYDYWFVQFDFPNENGKPYKSSGGKMVWNEELKREIPDGWEVKSLSEICNLSNGINYDKNEQGDKEYKIVNVRNITATSLLLDEEDFDRITLKSSLGDKYLIRDNDILIARSGTPGAIRLLEEVNDNTIYCGFIIRCSLYDKALRNYICFYLKMFEGTNATKTGGSILQNVSQETLNMIKIPMPKADLITSFNQSTEPIIKSMQNGINENQELASLRDFLLPMLMNGQVKVKKGENQ